MIHDTLKQFQDGVITAKEAEKEIDEFYATIKKRNEETKKALKAATELIRMALDADDIVKHALIRAAYQELPEHEI